MGRSAAGDTSRTLRPVLFGLSAALLIVIVGFPVMAIVLFAVSAFFYSYQTASESLSFSASLDYPYRVYAITFVGFGSVLTLAASVSYSRRSKNLGHKNYRV